MKKIFWSAWIVLSFGLPFLEGSAAAEHPIDAWLSDCMEKDPSSQGMNACLGQAYEKWDRELNRVYMDLSGRLDAEAGNILRDAQRAWLKFRDRELAFLATFYSNLAGTMYGTMLAADRVDLIKRRALELASYLDVLKLQ
jgi:uncharacterized protein YecT (DUF1311 family)